MRLPGDDCPSPPLFNPLAKICNFLHPHHFDRPDFINSIYYWVYDRSFLEFFLLHIIVIGLNDMLKTLVVCVCVSDI